MDLIYSNEKSLFCCFIDFKQCFDSIRKVDLWQNMQTEIKNEKCCEVIYNVHQNIKSEFQTNEGSSLYFDCLNGVRQGETLSPFLFSSNLNDLENLSDM